MGGGAWEDILEVGGQLWVLKVMDDKNGLAVVCLGCV